MWCVHEGIVCDCLCLAHQSKFLEHVHERVRLLRSTDAVFMVDDEMRHTGNVRTASIVHL